MAPAYRNQNRRQNRTGYVDHDVFEGLPVRQWRRDYITIVPPATQEASTQNDIWAVELPHGMPKDSHLLPQHSQDLLRAARSGKIYKRSAPVEEEEADAEAILGDKPDKKEDDPKDKGYTVKAWKSVPRHLEGPDIEYLAKRRKGLITAAPKAANPGPTLTKATVKRIDAAGNEYVQDVIIPQGQMVEGEVISQTTIPDPSANTSEGVPVPTPHKRKGPPKRKLKGPGRGRKKKVAPTSAPQIPLVEGVTQSVEGVDGDVSAAGVKIENEGTSAPANNEDTEMADGSMHDSDDEEGEEGEEGEDDDEGSVDNHGSPSKITRPISTPPQNVPTMTDIPSIGQMDTEMGGLEATARPPMLHLDRDRIEAKSGSPLKNVALTTSTLTSPLESPSTTTPAPFSHPAPVQDLKPIPQISEIPSLNEAIQQEAAAIASPTLPSPPPQPTLTEEIASSEVLKEEEGEEEMLLDIVENANNASSGADEALNAAISEAPETATLRIPETQEVILGPVPDKAPEAPIEQVDDSAPVDANRVEVQPDVPQSVQDDDDDDFPDLLGGLEKQLNDPVSSGDFEAAPIEESVPAEKVASPEKPAEVTEEEKREPEVAEEITKDNMDKA